MSTKSIFTLLTLINRISALTKIFSARKAQKITSNLLILTAVAITFGLHEARAGFPAPPGLPGLPAPPGLPGPNVNVRVNGYLPAPPGVHVLIDSGRPYYVERERRIYIERERPARYYKKKHYKKEKKHHRDHDREHHRDRDDD